MDSILSFSCHAPHCPDPQLQPRLWDTEALITGTQTNLVQKAYTFVSGGGRGRRRATRLKFSMKQM